MPPNILLIMTDQHSPHIAGFAGNEYVQTRSLDALAERSARFDAAYCQSPLCVPSRMSLWSGRYPHHCAAWDNRSVLRGMTIPRWLAQQGYTTAAVGKMHFRGTEQMHGFQARPYGDLVESSIAIHQPDPPDTADGRSNSHAVGRFPFAGVSAIPESLHVDRVVTTESLAWLLDHHRQEQPWFFCASYTRPHFPLTAPARYIQRYIGMELPQPPLPAGYPEALHPHDRFIVEDFGLTRFSPEEHHRALAAYYAAVDYVDDCIGDLLAGLDLAGCLDNTYIVYTADHGEMAGEHGLWWKRTYYEASARIPLLITGPGISQGTVIDTPVELVDLFPTFCDWASAPTPPDLDGESLAGLLTGGERQKHTAISELLGERPETQFRMARDTRWKYAEFPNAAPRLYDLQNDPDEWHDLWPQTPEEAPVEALQALLPGVWEALAQQRQEEYAQRPPFQSLSRAAAHYRLPDGRVIDADDHLYERKD